MDLTQAPVQTTSGAERAESSCTQNKQRQMCPKVSAEFSAESSGPRSHRFGRNIPGGTAGENAANKLSREFICHADTFLIEYRKHIHAVSLEAIPSVKRPIYEKASVRCVAGDHRAGNLGKGATEK